MSMIELRIAQAEQEHPSTFAISKTITAIQNAFEERNSGHIVGLCKSVIESFCYGGIDFYQKRDEIEGQTPTLKSLITKAVQVLPKEESITDKSNKAFNALLSIHYDHLYKLIDIATEIGKIRNDYCPISHGRASWFQDLDFAHAEYILHITDSMLMLMYHCIEFEKQKTALDYKDEDMKDFKFSLDNQTIIENNIVKIGESSFIPSQILFEMEPETYRIYYEEYMQEQGEKSENN